MNLFWQQASRWLPTCVVAVAIVAGNLDWSYTGLSQPNQIALAILLVAAFLWITETIPLFCTSLVILALSLTWLAPAIKQTTDADFDRNVFLAPFFSDIILLFFGGFVLAAGLHRLRLDEWLARKIVNATGSSFPKLILGVMAVTALLSMWLSNTATAAMMLAIVLPITGSLVQNDRYRQSLLLAVPIAANVGGLGTPIGSPPNAIAMQYMRQAGLEPTFFQWMLVGIPGVVGMLLLGWGSLLLLFRGSAKRVPETDSVLNLQFNWQMAVVLGTVLVTVVGWMTSALTGLSSGTVALLAPIVFFSSGILQTADLRSLAWDTLLMMGGGLCLGVALTESGLASFIVEQLPIDGLSIFQLAAVFGCVACVMSSVMSNTATANLILPIILGLQLESLPLLMVGTAFGCSLAMPLPVSTPPNAMAFSSGQIRVVDMLKPGILLTVVGMALAFSLGYWWWQFVLL